MFSAKLDGTADKVVLRGVRRDEAWAFELPLTGGSSQAGVFKSWAKRVIDHHIDGIAMGEDEDEVKSQVIDLALKFHMVTPYTSLVAVDKTQDLGAIAARTRAVASAAPHGSTLFGNMPSTATPAPLLLLLSALSGLFAVGFGRRSCRR